MTRLADVAAVAKQLFEGAAQVSAYLGTNDDLCVQAEYRIDHAAVRLAARRSDGALVELLVDHFGTRGQRGRIAERIAAERARHLSLRAGRRSGRHKRLS